jgi:hypothetical protein
MPQAIFELNVVLHFVYLILDQLKIWSSFGLEHI